jgi:hypothetical protein
MTRLLAAVFRRSTRLRRAYNAGAHDQRERIRQLAVARNATYRRPTTPAELARCGYQWKDKPFAALLKEDHDR